MGNVRFKIGDHTITAELLSQNDNKSRHTGKGLIQLEVQFKAHAVQRKSIQDALSGTGTLLSVDGDTSKDVTVLLYEKEYSYTDAHPMQNHIWTLTQKEELMLDSLQLAEISLQPYRFKETFDGDALIITARVEVDAATEEALRGLPKYFPVVRKGISEEPRSMRFGQILWSPVDDEQFKLALTIVEQNYDEQKRFPGILEPQFGNVMNSLAATSGRLAKLLEALRTKGLLTEEERLGIAEISDSERAKRVKQFDRVFDLDRWFDEEEEEVVGIG